MDLEKLITTNPIWVFFRGSFWPVISRTVREHCFSTSIPREPNLCILDFQPAPPDEFSNPEPGPSQRTQGWNTSARKPLLLIFATYCANTHSWVVSAKVSARDALCLLVVFHMFRHGFIISVFGLWVIQWTEESSQVTHVHWVPKARKQL